MGDALDRSFESLAKTQDSVIRAADGLCETAARAQFEDIACSLALRHAAEGKFTVAQREIAEALRSAYGKGKERPAR